MSAAPWMPLYVADYLADTAHLTAAEHGAYLLLIMHYWRAGKLPSDERQIARIARMNTREWDRSRDTIAAFFDAGWRHSRIENEIAKSVLKSNARAEAGSRGGHAKSLKNNDTGLAIATILPEQNAAVALASSSQSQSDNKETPIIPLSGDGAPAPAAPKIQKKSKTKNGPVSYSADFEIFWECYPPVDNQSKAKAHEAFARLDKPDRSTAIDGALALMKWLANEVQRRPEAGKFIPHAVTWINQRRWETLLEPNHRSRYEQRPEMH